jgi:rhamnose transport system permease protein
MRSRLRLVGADIERSGGLLVLLVVGFLVFRGLSSDFATESNLLTMARLDTENGIIAIGMAVVIASGGIDLSVGAILALSSVLVGYAYSHGTPLALAVAIGLVGGLVCGVVNGALVVVLRLNPLLVTLGTLALFRGLALGISGGAGYSGFPSSFDYVGQSYVGVVPTQAIAWLALVVGFAVLTVRTAWGRRVRAVGINDNAARLAGIGVGQVRLVVYGVSGLLAGVASIIYSSRVFSTRGDAGNGLELLAIAAVVVGGASIRGGEISILRTTLAVIALGMIPNGFVLAGIDTNWQYVTIGAVMIVAVVLDEVPFLRVRAARTVAA